MIAVITGASSGLGKALADELKDAHIIDWSKETGVDVRDEDSVMRAAKALKMVPEVLVNCAAVNEICWFSDLNPVIWDDVLNTNARGIFYTVRALMQADRMPRTIVNIISNASHMPMTASLAYNASKGAAHIMTLQMAREFGKTHGTTVFGISPNKLAGTNMSNYIDQRVPEVRGWTPEEAKAYQLASLPTGEETDPETLAEFIAFLLSSPQRHKFLHGTIIPYGA